MYDTLEGLDYKRGELSHYVSLVLNDVETAKAEKHLVYIPVDDIKVGDVCVKHYSSHLVLHPEYYHQWAVTRKADDQREEILVIPKEVLDKMRAAHIARESIPIPIS